MNNIYCVKCRKKTENAGKPVIGTAKNGRKYAKVKCAVCGTNKMMFLPKNQSGGCDCEDSEEEAEVEVKRPNNRKPVPPQFVPPVVLKKGRTG